MKCLIVDHDPESRLQLLAQLNAYKEIHVLAAVVTVAAAIPLSLTLLPDLIFLDDTLIGAEELLF